MDIVGSILIGGSLTIAVLSIQKFLRSISQRKAGG